MRLWFAAAVLLVAAAAPGQQPPPMSTVIVPVVGSVTGAGNVRWRTDVELRNDAGSQVTVMLTMPAAPEANFVMLPLDPGATVRFNDVASALGVDNGLSPLVVQTNNRRSATISAIAYGTRGNDVFPPQPIAISYGSTYFPVRVLRELSFSDEFRTNVGLANLGDAPAEFTLALQRVAGRNVAVTRVSLLPNTLWHMSIQSAFPLITNGDHFAVVVETASPQTYVYASVIENATNTARFVQPAFGVSPEQAQ
ncbi:MAG TPA: hypothetical protein VF980_16035 [Thermoanaerobaculia bacterium]